MGFLSATVADTGPRDVGLALDADAKQVIKLPVGLPKPPLGAAVTLGIRPEHCEVCAPEAAALVGTVLLLERLGADTFAFLDLPGAAEPVAVRLGARASGVLPGQRMGFTFDAKQAHLFDHDGECLPRGAL